MFDLVNLVRYPGFDNMIRERAWELFNSMVHEKNNKTLTLEFYTNSWYSTIKYHAYCRGKTVEFCPAAINQLLGLTTLEECEVQRRRREIKDMSEEDWEELLNTLCMEGMRWRKTKMLNKADFKPIPKAWASFVVQTLESTSCTYEIPIKRALTFAAILSGNPINVGELIANNIYEIVARKLKIVGNSSVINWFCEEVVIDEYKSYLDTPIIDPITDKTMDTFVKKYENYMREREGREYQGQ